MLAMESEKTELRVDFILAVEVVCLLHPRQDRNPRAPSQCILHSLPLYRSCEQCLALPATTSCFIREPSHHAVIRIVASLAQYAQGLIPQEHRPSGSSEGLPSLRERIGA